LLMFLRLALSLLAAELYKAASLVAVCCGMDFPGWV
jgi:hypothetical protein